MAENQIDLEKLLHSLNEKSSISDIQNYVNKMVEVRGFDNETPQDILLLLTEELGELAKEVRKSTNIKIDSNETRNQNLDKEIADVFNYILALCRVTNVNLLEAYKEKEEINLKRIWK